MLPGSLHYSPVDMRGGLLILATVAALCGGCAAEPAEEYRPNLVVVLIDALRADRLGVDGYPLPTTPHIDALAGEGVFFGAALAHSTWTKPSIATLMTSLYPSQHGIQRASVGAGETLRTEVLDDGLVTLAERLKAGGYATGAFINQVHLRARFGFAQGFDEFQDRRGRNAFQLNRQMEAWLETSPGEPFFAYVHYLDLHWPFTLKMPEHEGLFGSTEMKSQPPLRGNLVPEWGRQLNDEDDLKGLLARYDHEVAYTDAGVGDLVRRLRDQGVFEDTVVIVTSDHGEGFLEHEEMGHGFAPYDEVLRIPMVVRLPERLREGTGRIDEPVGLIDLMPTLLDLAGVEPEPQAHGESFVPLFGGESLGERVFFSETFDAFAARTQAHKLIWFVDDRTLFFDVGTDAAEANPIPPPCAGPCRELARQLSSFRQLMLDSRESNPAGTAVLRPGEIEALRALGYVD